MGIAKVSDILKHDCSFKSKIELETIYNITIPNMKYNKIISSLKSKIGNLPLGNNYSLVLFYLGFYVAFNTVQVISRRVVGRAEETST